MKLSGVRQCVTHGSPHARHLRFHHRPERDQAGLSGRGQHPLHPADLRRGDRQRRSLGGRDPGSRPIDRRPEDPHPRDRVGHEPAEHGARATRPCGRCGPASTPGASTSRPTRCCTIAERWSWRRRFGLHDGDPRVEGLLVRYLHFYGGFDTVATHRRWYRREVRAVRLDPALDIRPYQGAQGFRVGPEHRKIRARLTRAEMFHYGWARPAQALREKRELGKTMYPWRNADERQPLLAWIPGIQPFRGTHPSAAREWIEQRRVDPDRVIAPRRFQLSLYPLLRLRGDRAADGRAGLRVPELHAGLSRAVPTRIPARPATAPAAARRCDAAARAHDPRTRSGRAPRARGCSGAPARRHPRASDTRRSAGRPRARYSMSSTQRPRKNPAAAKDLPHAVGRARASGILFGVGVGAQRDRRALDDLRESAAIDRAAARPAGRTGPHPSRSRGSAAERRRSPPGARGSGAGTGRSPRS